MKEFKRTQNQEDLDGIINQKKRLVEVYKTQVKLLEEREKRIKNELKPIKNSKKKV